MGRAKLQRNPLHGGVVKQGVVCLGFEMRSRLGSSLGPGRWWWYRRHACVTEGVMAGRGKRGWHYRLSFALSLLSSRWLANFGILFGGICGSNCGGITVGN
jgi:hypothetical protein